MTPWCRRAAAGLVAGAMLAGGSSAVAAPTPPTTSPATSGVSPVAAERRPMPDVWWYDAMALDEVHAEATGEGVKVAVIDGYLNTEVPDLRGARISKGTHCRGGGSPDLSGQLADHGTAMVTAIVGQGTGNGPGGRGVVGVAPDAEVRFLSFDTDPSNPLVECDAVLIADQIDKAVAWGADVISMSIGSGGGLEESIGRAWESGAVVVAASGEVADGRPREEQPLAIPASLPGVVAVAAGDSDGQVWDRNPTSASFSDQYLTVVAPGVETPIGGYPEGQGWQSGAARTGTSGATAITAGAFAVLKSRWPEATGSQLIQSVVHNTSGNDTGELTFGQTKGYGVLSLARVLKVDPTGYPDENPLLMPPGRAAKAYPASSYDAKSAAEDDPATDESASPRTEEEAAGTPAATDATDASEDGTAVPIWAVVLGGLVLVALAAGALLLRRRTSSRPTSPSTDHTQTSDSTYDHTAPRGN